MGLLATAKSWLGMGKAPSTKPRASARHIERMNRKALRARYESAQTTTENSPLWGLTDYFSARSANSFQVRRTLKVRSRYEAGNNSYFRGIIDTLAHDLIATGPRLQAMTHEAAVNKVIQAEWSKWAVAVGLSQKLRTMAKAKIGDGEAFALAVNNREIDNPVQLDWNVIESDQVMTPDPSFTDQFWVDGIVLNDLGNPKAYHVLRHHPGDLLTPVLNPLQFDTWPARNVLHWFRIDRPGQARGIPEITPALDLFAALRRYTKAVMTAAETAADFAVMLESDKDDAAAGDADDEDAVPFSTSPIDRGMMVKLPGGEKASQMRAEQPATTYEMWVRCILREICRCLQVPLTIAMGDYADLSYSGGRLEHLVYHRGQKVSRNECESVVLAKIFRSWFAEARLIRGLLPPGLPPVILHRWFWDSTDSIDPEKDATAEQLQIDGHTTTLEEIYAEKGQDWEERIRQRGREVALMEELGLPVETARKILDTQKGKTNEQQPEETAASGGNGHARF